MLKTTWKTRENKTVNCTGTLASSMRVPYYSAAAMMALVVAAVAQSRGYISSPFQDSPSRQHCSKHNQQRNGQKRPLGARQVGGVADFGTLRSQTVSAV